MKLKSQSTVRQKLTEIFIATPAKILISCVVPIITFLILYFGFIFMRDVQASKLLIAIVALTVGVGGVWLLYWSTNNFVEILPSKVRDALRPFVFVGPAVAILTFYIVLPAVRTIWISFFNRSGEKFVWFKNYIFTFTDSEMLVVLRNTLLWVVFVPFLAVSLGLIIAVMADRLQPKWEKITKLFIFLPMAISFVGASIIWRFMYYYQPEGYEQIGLLNSIITSFGKEPIAWIIQRPWNNFALIVIMVWLQTGFAMVILSAAVKSVPSALSEAARIDGAGEIKIFFSVTIPYIQGTILTVWTTILFLVLKVFDIVYVMTSGNYETGIVASRMYKETFVYRNFGRGAALSVFLFIVVIPFLIRNVKQLRQQRI